MAGTNNFLVFNEANNPTFTMSDADYYADLYRLNGLIPMIADPLAHNKMFRQWSIMIKALADIIASMNYNASDSDLATLETNLKSTIEDVAEAKVNSRINTLEDWKSSITASAGEINILDGAEVSTTEINYLSGASSNIQTQINNLSISALFPLWQESTSYSVGDVVKTANCSFWEYWECVVAGTSDTIPPTSVNIGDLLTDGTAKWLVLDMRDSNPVGTIKHDLVVRTGYLVLDGQTINVVDYPRLVNFLSTNSLIKAYTATPNTTEFTYGNSDNTTVILPNFNNLFIESCLTTPYVLEKVEAGLPNATGKFTPQLMISNYSADKHKVGFSSVEGVFGLTNSGNTYPLNNSVAPSSGTTDTSKRTIEFKLSNSNSIYGNSATVQPPAVKLLPIIKY